MKERMKMALYIFWWIALLGIVFLFFMMGFVYSIVMTAAHF